MRSKSNVQKKLAGKIARVNVPDKENPSTSINIAKSKSADPEVSLSPIINAGNDPLPKFKASTPKPVRTKGTHSQTLPINIRKKRKPRVVKEIKKLRRTTELLLRKLPFSRLVREIANELKIGGDFYRWQITALAALQEASEAFLISLMEAGYQCSLHAKRITLMPKDLNLVRFIRSED